MENELNDKFSDLIEEVELIPGSGGIYEVSVDGGNVFSKKELNRFPEDGEIVKLIRECQE